MRRAGDGGPSASDGVESLSPGVCRREAPADGVDPAAEGASGGEFSSSGHAGPEGPAAEAGVVELDSGRGDAVEGTAEDEENRAEGGAGGADGGERRGGEEARFPAAGGVKEEPAGLVRGGADVEAEEGLGSAEVRSHGEEERGAE